MVRRHALATVRRHAGGNAVQMASLALGLTAVLLLTFTRNDVVDGWRRTAQPDAPNRFLIGVQPDQREPVRQHFAARGMAAPELFPMVRGRLVALNRTPVVESEFTDERARRPVEREFNLSYMIELPRHHTLTAGRWFRPAAREVSVEEGIAKTLGWKPAAGLTFPG